MSELKNVKKIVQLFVYYYKNVNKRDYYVFKMTENKKKVVLSFIERIKQETNSELQDGYLNQYFEYQFNRWYKKENPNGKGISIQIEWIVGKKAIELWLGRDKLKSAFIVRKNLKTDVTFKRKEVKENYDAVIVKLNPVEENDKERFYNSVKGFSYCELSTTLFNHLSDLCNGCKSKEKCKILLLKEYPKIYKKRGYEN